MKNRPAKGGFFMHFSFRRQKSGTILNNKSKLKRSFHVRHDFQTG
jgi:hypothetical protein